MRRALMLVALAGCSGPMEPRIVARTPAMVSIESYGRFPQTVTLAQATCAESGRDAVQRRAEMVGRDPTVERHTFECVAR